MKYCDFDVLGKNQNEVILLDEEVAKFLMKQKAITKQNTNHKKVKYVISKSSWLSTVFDYFPGAAFSHDLIQSGPNQWHVMSEEFIGSGSFGAVQKSKYKIVVSDDLDHAKAQLIPVNDVIKIQRALPDKYEYVRELAEQEALMQHSHGVDVVSVVDTGDKIITILEDCGISLEKLVPFNSPAKYSFQSRLEIAARITNEMLLLQQKGVVHHDLKPENICYKQLDNGKFIIIFIDFGLAKKLDGPIRVESRCLGSLDFMSPEMLLRGYSDYASDMYALAPILGMVFGAFDVEKYKCLFESKQDVAKTRYCFNGLFTGYDTSQIDSFIKEDIKNLLNDLQQFKAKNRPTIDVVNKFFITLPARMSAYQLFNKNWSLMLNELTEVENFIEQLHVLELDPALKLEMLRKKAKIDVEISALPAPLSHYELSKRWVRNNEIADLIGDDNPYPKFDEITEKLKALNLQSKQLMGDSVPLLPQAKPPKLPRPPILDQLKTIPQPQFKGRFFFKSCCGDDAALQNEFKP